MHKSTSIIENNLRSIYRDIQNVLDILLPAACDCFKVSFNVVI